MKILIKNDRMLTTYIGALRKCPNWDGGNKLGKVLPGIEAPTVRQVDELVAAYNETSELRGSLPSMAGSRASTVPDWSRI